MKRVLTAVFGVPLIVAAVYWLPTPWILAVAMLCVELAVLEYVRLTRQAGADRVVALLLLLVPISSLALNVHLWGFDLNHPQALAIGAFVASSLIGIAALASRGGFASSLAAIGAASFGLPYFVLATVSYVRLHEASPWLVILLLVIVWGGDTAAFYVGTRWGKRKLAPVVSPNKTWEGAVASFVTALVGIVLWSWLRFRELDLPIFTAGAVTAVAAQVGDLLESLFKRGVGVKDSGDLLPGHGGMLDRMDAILLAGPTFYLMLLALGAAH